MKIKKPHLEKTTNALLLHWETEADCIKLLTPNYKMNSATKDQLSALVHQVHWENKNAPVSSVEIKGF